MKTHHLLHSILFWLYAFLLFATPLIVTPFTDELFEFPKMVFVYLGTITILLIYVVKIIKSGKIVIKKSPLNLPFILIAISSFLATIFSLHPLTSIFGYYSRFNGSLLSIFCYLALSFILTNEFKSAEVKKLITTLIISSFFVSLYGILQRFGIDRDYWIEHAWERVFSTLGQPNWLAAFLVMLIPYNLYLTIQSFSRIKRTPTQKQKLMSGGIFLLLLFTFSLLLFTLFFTRSASGYMGLFIALFILLLYFFVTSSLRFKRFLLIFIASTIFISILFMPFYPSLPFSLRDLFWEKETNQIRLLAWKGTLGLIAAKPILGYGLETFAYSFLAYRPTELNYTSEWNFLFNKPHNEYLEILSESGVIGLGVYLFLILSFLLWLKKFWIKAKHQTEIVALLSGYTGLLVALFFGFQVVITNLLFFLFPAFIVALSEARLDTKIILFRVPSKLKSLFYCLLFTVYCLLFIPLSRYFLANIFYDLGSLLLLEKAVAYVPFEDTYRRHLAYAYVNSLDENANHETKAVSEIQTTLINNPHNLLNLQTLTKTYLELSLKDEKYLESALDLAKKQTLLCPTDPETFYTYGLILMSMGKDEEAKQAFLKALELKSDYDKPQEMLKVWD